MHSEKICIGLSVLAGLGAGLAQDVILEDSYFYGQSPPVYPSPNTSGTGDWASAYAKAKAFVAQMTIEEKVNITEGYTTTNGCGGGIPAIERLGFPGLCMNDAGNGVRGTDFVSAWPSGLHVAASWNKDLALQRATAMGKEAKKKGINTLLGPVVGPAYRLPLGGRNWEGFAADPYLSGILVGETVTGLQDSGVMACVKHFVGNEQETYRIADGNISSVSSNVDDATLHEYYVWPFQNAIRAGAASVMCSYNRLNNSHSCQNSKLLNGVLKEELGFQGFVMSDWYALSAGYAAAAAGLDMAMPSSEGLWADNLTLSVTNGSLEASRVDDMVTRILSSWYLLDQDTEIPVPGVGLTADLTVPHTIVDARDAADRPVLVQGAKEGHVLVKNEGALPLKSPRLIYVAGYSAREADQTSPSVSGNGFTLGYTASQEMVEDYTESFTGTDRPWRRGPAIGANGTMIAGGGSGAPSMARIASPFHALVSRSLEDNTEVYWDLDSALPTADAAADVCLVFGNAWATESVDRPALYDDYTDALIESVADSCNNTVVILHNAGVRLVERWIDHPNITAVVFAHLPGEASGQALVSLLYGDDNFSGKLPYTVPQNESDYGASVQGPDMPEGAYLYYPQSNFSEGVYIDYRYFDEADITPRYEFGYGLSYTTFAYSGLQVSGCVSLAEYPVGDVVEGGRADLWDTVATVSATVANTGSVAGQEVAQLYVAIPGAPARQLRGFDKPSLAAGASATVSFALTRRDLSVWDIDAQQWRLQEGNYTVYVGSSSRTLPLQGSLVITTA